MKKILLILFIIFLSSCASVNHVPYNPTAAKINVQLGLGYMKEGQMDRAREKLLRALDEAPDLSEVQMAMGYFFMTLKEFEQAKSYYQKALKLSSNDPSVQNNYGVYLCRSGAYKESVHYFLLAANNPRYLHPESAYQNAGLCALKIPDRKLAKQYFKKAGSGGHK